MTSLRDTWRRETYKREQREKLRRIRESNAPTLYERLDEIPEPAAHSLVECVERHRRRGTI